MTEMAKSESDEQEGKSKPKAKVTLLLACLVAGVIIGMVVSSVVFGTGGKAVLSKSEVGNKTLTVVKNIQEQQGSGIQTSLLDIGEYGNNLYIVNLSMTLGTQTQLVSVYVTKDGKLIPQSQSAFAIDIVEETKNASQATTTPTSTPTPTPTGYPKSTKPNVKFFVMSFCPYGQQAETALKPVADLLGNKAEMEPHFIVSVSGNAVSSLHGENEAAEDMRQACILKYAKDKWWEYVSYVNSNCTRTTISTCWEQAADNAGIDKSNITACYENEGIGLMRADSAYGVGNSPTIYINDRLYNGDRTPAAFKEAICSAFSSPPAECSQTSWSSPTTTATVPAVACAAT